MTLTKEAILVQIWGEDSDTTENNVEAYISFIREKIKYLGSRVVIRNIRGIGYTIEFAEEWSEGKGSMEEYKKALSVSTFCRSDLCFSS